MPSLSTGPDSLENLVDQLPVELWKRIFQSLRPDSKGTVNSLWEDADLECEIAALLSDQARFYQLKLVCSRFHQVFLQHPELSDEVILAKGNASNLMPSLLLWLRRFAKSVYTVTTFGNSQYQDTVLGCLSCLESELAHAYLTGVSSATIHILASFSSLRGCELNMPERILDLQPLRLLACLSDLSLAGGTFTNLSIGSQLTSIHIETSHASCLQGPNHASSLRSLQCHHAALFGFHERGLSGCISLVKLALTETVFHAAMPEETFAVGNCVEISIPGNMSDLTQLSSLSIELASSSPAEFVLDWICTITSLVELDVNVQSECLVRDSLTLLSRLTSLKVSNLADESDDQLLCFDVSWHAMQALQHIELTGPLAFDDGIIELTTLQHLSVVSFSELYPKHRAASSLARLAYQLAAHCPHVSVKIDGRFC